MALLENTTDKFFHLVLLLSVMSFSRIPDAYTTGRLNLVVYAAAAAAAAASSISGCSQLEERKLGMLKELKELKMDETFNGLAMAVSQSMVITLSV